MLDAPTRRAAEGEGQRREQRARRMPAAIAEIQHQREAARRQHGEDDAVLQLKRRLGRSPGGEKKKRRKNQRLRIGDLRHAGEDIGRPKRRLARMQRVSEKGELRLEMRLGVPGNGVVAGQKGKSERESGEQKHRRRRAIKLVIAFANLCHAVSPSAYGEAWRVNSRFPPRRKIARRFTQSPRRSGLAPDLRRSFSRAPASR